MRVTPWARTIILVAMAALVLLFSPALRSQACAEDSSILPSAQARVVRVGYFYNGDYMSKDEDGNYRGYDVEYYYTIAGYAGWTIQFVDYDSLTAALAGLENGDVDVMSGLSKTDERVEKYLVSAQKMSTSHIAVQTRADDDRFSAGDTSTMGNLTCGILKGSNVVTLYTAWCAENNLTPHVVEYDSIPLRNAALAAGEVDAIAAGSTVEGAQKIAEFPALDLYFMFNRDQGALKSQLDNAMSILNLSDPAFSTDLYFKYFPSSKNATPSFSASEKAFIAAHQTLRIAVLKDDAPFSKQAGDGTVSGIIPEYLAHVGDVMGASIQCVGFDTKADACKALAAGEVDAIGKFTYDVFDAASYGFILCNPDITLNMVQISRVGTSEVLTAAIPDCNFGDISGSLERNGIALDLSSCSNGEACFEKLKSGSVDAVICSQATATWLLNRNRSTDYVVSSFSSDTWKICCALPSGTDGNTFRSILNKVTAVDGGYINQLITADTLQDSEDAATLLDRIPIGWLVTMAVAFFLMFAVAIVALVVIVRQRATERELVAKQAESDRREASIAAEEKANEERHAFFGTVSHDMRTPLNGIMGFTDLAMKSDDLSKVRDYLAKIKMSGDILTDLVDDTLVMSRIESGKQTMSLAPNDTFEMLDEICAPIQAIADEKGIRFVEDFDQTRRRTILVDRTSIQKVLLNLLTNAIRFTPSGGTVSLKVALEPLGSSQPDSLITISDTGEGISREFLPHVFDPFTQEEAAKAGNQGTGLGLTIVKRLVDAMAAPSRSGARRARERPSSSASTSGRSRQTRSRTLPPFRRPIALASRECASWSARTTGSTWRSSVRSSKARVQRSRWQKTDDGASSSSRRMTRVTSRLSSWICACRSLTALRRPRRSGPWVGAIPGSPSSPFPPMPMRMTSAIASSRGWMPTSPSPSTRLSCSGSSRGSVAPIGIRPEGRKPREAPNQGALRPHPRAPVLHDTFGARSSRGLLGWHQNGARGYLGISRLRLLRQQRQTNGCRRGVCLPNRPEREPQHRDRSHPRCGELFRGSRQRQRGHAL